MFAAVFLFSSTVFAEESKAPNMGGILSMIGRFTSAHGCPVAADRVLTNSHVTDLRPFDDRVPMFPYRFSSETQSGSFFPDRVSGREDLSWGTTKPLLDVFYPIAPTQPLIGETVYWVGYDWKNRKNAFRRKIFSGKVLAIVAGNLILDSSTPRGSSGSCVLNSRGETVGIIDWGIKLDNEEEAAVAVGIWGDWLNDFQPTPVQPTEQS
jgi:hypothetical protein